MISIYLIYQLIYPPIHLSIPLTGIPAKGVAFLVASHYSRASAAMRATYVLPRSNLAQLHGSRTSRTWINGYLLKSTMKMGSGRWIQRNCILRLSPCRSLHLLEIAHSLCALNDLTQAKMDAAPRCRSGTSPVHCALWRHSRIACWPIIVKLPSFVASVGRTPARFNISIFTLFASSISFSTGKHPYSAWVQ